jgi:hypothetical protein
MRRSGFTRKDSWKRLERHSHLRSLGKKGKTWKKKRDELKIAHTAMGVTTCELRYENCANDDYLGFAHAAKRRKLTKEDLGHVILACNFCHDKLEVMPPEEMKRIVDTTCQQRELMPINL